MKKVIVNYAAILSGLAIAAFGVVAFVLPQGIMIGGTTGIGRILYYFYGIPVSYTVGAVNIILFSIGAFILGKKFALSVVVSTFAYPAFINLFEHMDFLAEISDDGLLSAIFGGVIVGCGIRHCDQVRELLPAEAISLRSYSIENSIFLLVRRSIL